MKYVDLSQHLHELRAAKTGRPIGASMLLSEVWTAALDCPRNGISEIRYFETDLPTPFDGAFFRLRNDSLEIAAIYVQKDHDLHWREFIAIKELMHCWSPHKTYVGTPQAAKDLVSALTRKNGPYMPNVAEDNGAVLAAAEVILPHSTARWHLDRGHDTKQIAASQNLHIDVVDMICRHDILAARLNGSL